MEKPAIAVHACGFENETEVCLTFKLRLLKVLNIIIFQKENCQNIMISGGVSYKPHSSFLAHLGGKWLEHALGPFNHNICVSYAVDCYNSSTDVQNFIKIALEQNFTRIIAVSSSWHLLALKPLYRYWKKRLNFGSEISFVEAPSFVGAKTICFYLIYSFLIRTSLMLGCFKFLDGIINSVHSKRTNGYPVSGCD